MAQLPNNQVVQATHTGYLPIHKEITHKGSEVLIFPHLTNESLISVGQLCDDGCIVFFTKNDFAVLKNNRLLFKGLRNKQDGLWDFNSTSLPKTPHQVNYIIKKNATQQQLAQYYHATLFSPVVSTLETAIKKGNLITWPGIQTLSFFTIIDTTIATELGHLDQERRNLRSTKIIDNTDSFPEKSNIKTSDTFIQCFNVHTDIKTINYRKIYSDQTGKFPYKSSRGNQYIMIMYDFDSNAILVEPLKSRQGKELTSAFNKCRNKLNLKDNIQNLFVLDNECSFEVKRAITNTNSTFQLVPPHQHRVNAAEKAIRTFKNHLLSGIATCDPEYPITEWDRLLPQAELMLNLLRNSRLNPKLSSLQNKKTIYPGIDIHQNDTSTLIKVAKILPNCDNVIPAPVNTIRPITNSPNAHNTSEGANTKTPPVSSPKNPIKNKN